MSRSTMSNPLPALPSILSDQFYDTAKITNPPAMHMESASRREPNADAVWTRRICKHHLENGISGVEHLKQNL